MSVCMFYVQSHYSVDFERRALKSALKLHDAIFFLVQSTIAPPLCESLVNVYITYKRWFTTQTKNYKIKYNFIKISKLRLKHTFILNKMEGTTIYASTALLSAVEFMTIRSVLSIGCPIDQFCQQQTYVCNKQT
jgi:hypothetical protein